MNIIKYKLSLENIKRFTWAVAKHFIENNCGNRAEILAFSTILSLVPLLAVFLSILTFFESFRQFVQLIENFIFNYFVPDIGNMVKFYLQDFVHKAIKFSIINLIFLWVICIKMLFEIEEAFNAIWTAKKRPLISAAILYGITLILFPLTVGAAAVLISQLLNFSFFLYAADLIWLKIIVLSIFPAGLIFGIFFLLYMAVPHTRVKISCAAGGALFSTVCFTGLKNVFVGYIQNFTSYNLLYSTLSVIPVFLIWVYCMWFIILLGSAVAYVLQNRS